MYQATKRNEEITRKFVRDYLDEWKMLNPKIVNETDDEDKIMKELDFFFIISDFFHLGFFIDLASRNMISVTLVSYLMISFTSMGIYLISLSKLECRSSFM